MTDRRAAVSRNPLPPHKRWIFRLLLLGLPLLILGALEGVLRWQGMGGFPPLAAELGEVQGKRLIEVQPLGTQSYFFGALPGRGSARAAAFYEPKDPNTFRILLAGESAILGFPQPKPLTAGSFLEWGLERVWPERNVEIINLGTTAVASFPVYDMVRQLLPYQPDLVVLYLGNNEFYGSYGVCSTHSAGRHPALMPLVRRAQGLALVQVIERFLVRVNQGNVRDEILMERMMAKRRVAPDSPLRTRAANNLAYHVRKIADLCAEQRIPLMVCSLAANEKDLAPIGSDASHRPEEAIPALTAFRRAGAMVAAGDTAGAAQAFTEALDTDPMPWRPTTPQQDALRTVAKEKGLLFCDVRGLFRRLSPGGVVGWELMDDHVHFSLPGQYALALAVMQMLTETPGRLQVTEAALRDLPNWETVASSLGANPYEYFATAHGLWEIFSTGFMRTSNPEAADRMAARMQAAIGAMEPTIAEAFTAAVRSRGKPGSSFRSASGTAAEMLVARGKLAEAVPLLDFACRSLPDFSPTRRINAALMYACLNAVNQFDDVARKGAREEIERGHTLLTLGADPSGITEFAMAQLFELLGQPAEAQRYRERAEAKNPTLQHAWPLQPSTTTP